MVLGPASHTPPLGKHWDLLGHSLPPQVVDTVSEEELNTNRKHHETPDASQIAHPSSVGVSASRLPASDDRVEDCTVAIVVVAKDLPGAEGARSGPGTETQCIRGVAPINPSSIEEGDEHDAILVSEYADEIFEYMGELEVLSMAHLFWPAFADIFLVSSSRS